MAEAYTPQQVSRSTAGNEAGGHRLNIFKVLASGRYPFKEEEASALLGWLLSPRMDHGLGFLFLKQFLGEVAHAVRGDGHRPQAASSLLDLRDRLDLRLRDTPTGQSPGWIDTERGVSVWSSLEYPVVGSQIDVLLGIDDWLFAVENKIYSSSAQDTVQLRDQYEGLVKKRKSDTEGTAKRIVIVFLVPYNVPDARLMAEYSGLDWAHISDPNDLKCLLSWQEPSDDHAASEGAVHPSGPPAEPDARPPYIPSISGMIGQLLADEAAGSIDPIPQYTRQTLKALRSFIQGDFQGYDYDRPSRASGWNAATEGMLTLGEIRERGGSGYVGVMHGISGLLDLSPEELSSRGFQYTTEDMSKRRGVWMKASFFCSVAEWLVQGKVPDAGVDWDECNGRLKWSHLLTIAKAFGDSVFIGIQGGEDGLRRLSPNQIREKRWQIGSTSAPQWIPGDVYVRILEEKRLTGQA